MMFNNAKWSDGTMLRFLDMPDVQHPPMTEEQHKQYEALMAKGRELSKNVTVSAFSVVDGKPAKRVQVQMSRTTLDKINAMHSGDQ
ncbi:hypothetical protein pEaSNUABM14_00335 [Erwinia phage pEa_SNUABM_14]|uniref:Uncharacterized protein n=1 Tax=Erwinia phage pEa_SNUABM_7 TaxID=2866695 RepID=A0AAE8BM11_9CAUD|nr:hypothetical protein MPK74_gp338 [Erwinia phage pEa_SNUABM_7]QYW03294.1 hypothetical protein pEaSNUABM13_00336 [Erwinia phage pEa_SNUABM_13]QYW04660.1 hypothetical protein pEaSNUABM14_00335 [Erwinia phage pEa_SNUABM_14]QYW05006.1 hypothetical protein pEaSNUABM7_00338 [Erwinia phage pEa_SNUABM_7]